MNQFETEPAETPINAAMSTFLIFFTLHTAFRLSMIVWRISVIFIAPFRAIIAGRSEPFKIKIKKFFIFLLTSSATLNIMTVDFSNAEEMEG